MRVLTTAELDTNCLWQPCDITPESTAFIQYTSGSTSEPKGVIIRHDSLLFNQVSIKDKNKKRLELDLCQLDAPAP